MNICKYLIIQSLGNSIGTFKDKLFFIRSEEFYKLLKKQTNCKYKKNR